MADQKPASQTSPGTVARAIESQTSQGNPTSNDLSRLYGTNWNQTNVLTLFEWLTIAAYNIKCLELGTTHFRTIIRNNTILGLILSTLSGTLSVSQLGIQDPGQILSRTLNAVFVVLSYSIAIFTGYLKIYQIQERLEQYIKVKQDWIAFSTGIASELQLPIALRRDALWIIIKNKNTYLDLLKMDLEFPKRIQDRARAEFGKHNVKGQNIDVSTLSQIIMDIGIQELEELKQSAASKNNPAYIENVLRSVQKLSNTKRTLDPKAVPMLEVVADEESVGTAVSTGVKKSPSSVVLTMSSETMNHLQ
jgi:hypothetical protein